MASFDPKIAFIGFGEAATAFALGFSQQDFGSNICAFDKKTEGSQAAAKRADYVTAGVEGLDTAKEACRDADVVFSLVTADQAETAAEVAAENPLSNAFYFDCNSCAPDTKRRSAQIIDAAGGRYVDVAIMTPVHPKLHKSPCLIAGPHAEDAQDMMRRLGMEVEIAGMEVGEASARKMVRSVMIKGLEALTLECFLAARKAGVEHYLLKSLEGSFPGFDWQRRAPYMIERAMTHGVRRAAEMKEVAQTLHDLELDAHMTEATVKRQSAVGQMNLDASSVGADNLAELTDAILAAHTSSNR